MRNRMCIIGYCSRPASVYLPNTGQPGSGHVCDIHAKTPRSRKEQTSSGLKTWKKKTGVIPDTVKYPKLKGVLARYLQNHIECERHKYQGKRVDAIVVDHIISVRRIEKQRGLHMPFPDPLYNPENFQALCGKCHLTKLGGEKRGVISRLAEGYRLYLPG